MPDHPNEPDEPHEPKAGDPGVQHTRDRLTADVDDELAEQRTEHPFDVDPTRERAFETRLISLDDAAHEIDEPGRAEG